MIRRLIQKIIEFFTAKPTSIDKFQNAYNIALGEVGVHEIEGKARNNPRILEYLNTVGDFPVDETPWCAAFINWCLLQAGIRGTYRPNARSFLNLIIQDDWIEVSDSEARAGDIVVLWRESVQSWKGHVAFLEEAHYYYVYLLGGNQDNMVCTKRYPKHRVLKYLRYVGD